MKFSITDSLAGIADFRYEIPFAKKCEYIKIWVSGCDFQTVDTIQTASKRVQGNRAGACTWCDPNRVPTKKRGKGFPFWLSLTSKATIMSFHPSESKWTNKSSWWKFFNASPRMMIAPPQPNGDSCCCLDHLGPLSVPFSDHQSGENLTRTAQGPAGSFKDKSTEHFRKGGKVELLESMTEWQERVLDANLWT